MHRPRGGLDTHPLSSRSATSAGGIAQVAASCCFCAEPEDRSLVVGACEQDGDGMQQARHRSIPRVFCRS